MQNKFYFYPSDRWTFEDEVARYLEKREKDDSLKFVIVTGKDEFLDKSFASKCKEMLSYLKNKKIFPHNIGIGVDEDSRRFDSDEWSKVKALGDLFAKQGINFGFEDMEKTWSVQEVETANSKIVETADAIRKTHLSPYEKLLMAYLKVTSRKYVQEDTEKEHFSVSRSVIGVLNTDRIVCVGYAEWLKAIIEEIGDENIQVYNNGVACSLDGKHVEGFHRNLIIHIKDEKYGIDGYYYLDPTWDGGHQFKNTPDLLYFMVPLSDIDKIRYQIRDRDALSMRQGGSKPTTKKSKQKVTSEVYNMQPHPSVGFSSDKFVLTEEFLKDAKSLYPEFASILRDEVMQEEYLKKIGSRDQYRKDIEILSGM